MTYDEVITELQRIANPKSKRDYQNHGANENIYGVSVVNLRQLATSIGQDHELALRLYDSGNFDAVHLCAMVAQPSKLSEDTLNSMVSRAYCHVLSDYVVASLAAEQETPLALKLANHWIASDNVLIASAGWTAYSMILRIHKDDVLPETEIRSHLSRIGDSFSRSSDIVKHAMIGFVIAAGTAYVPLHKEALALAEQLGKTRVSLAKAGAKTLQPAADIQRILGKGHLGKKRKSFR